MPRLNARGDVGAGIGGAIVSVNDQVIATNAGGACWLTDDLLLYQHGAHLETFDTRNGEIREIDPQGCYELAAGGGAYAAKFDDGVRVSSQPGQRYAFYGVGDVGPDGAVLLKQPDGTFQGFVPQDLQSLGGSSWSALTNFRPVQSPDLPAPVVLDGRISGYRRTARCCCYLHEGTGRFVVQHLDRPVGAVIAYTAVAYRPDLVELPGDQIAVTYAISPEEAPGQIVTRVLPLAQLTTDLAPGPIVVPVPNPTPTPMPVPNQLSTVQAVRANYPTPLGAQHGAFLIEVARATGGKLLRKDAGSHVTLPSGQNVSQDILVFSNGQECFDILSDAEGAAVPSWQDKGVIPGEYIDVSDQPTPNPNPDPNPDPQPPDTELVKRVESLERRLQRLENAGLLVAQVYRP